MHIYSLTPEQAAFARATAEIVSALLRVEPVAPKETYTLADLRTVLACESNSAVYRALKLLKIAPFLPGKYRRRDVENQMAKASLRARRAANYVDERGRETEPKQPPQLR